jgi:type IV fimbrial biogenesis protein FimT
MVSARNRAGFTMVELLITIAVVGIVTAIALPSYRELVASQRLRAASSDLFTSMVQARSEAIKRNKPVTISAAGGSWAAGWNTVNPTQAGVYLDQHGPVTNATIAAPASVTFLSNGRISGNSVPTFDISMFGTTNVRCVKTDLGGRPMITKAAC